MQTAEVPAGGWVPRLGRAFAIKAWVGLLLAILTFLVIYPIFMLVLGALSDTNPIVDGWAKFQPSLSNFVTVLGNPNVHAALGNTLIACAGGTALAVAIGLTFSWIVVRTDTPLKGFIGAVSMIPLFVPPLVAGVAWSILGSPKTGLINTTLKWIGIDWRINLYSMTGLIVVFGIVMLDLIHLPIPSFFTGAQVRGARRGGYPASAVWASAAVANDSKIPSRPATFKRFEILEVAPATTRRPP